MDSKDDEQARGITMKSSSISLLHVPGAAARPEGPNSVPREERLETGAGGTQRAAGGWAAAAAGAAGGSVARGGGAACAGCT